MEKRERDRECGSGKERDRENKRYFSWKSLWHNRDRTFPLTVILDKLYYKVEGERARCHYTKGLHKKFT